MLIELWQILFTKSNDEDTIKQIEDSYHHEKGFVGFLLLRTSLVWVPLRGH